jgi:hypothetical protein
LMIARRAPTAAPDRSIWYEWRWSSRRTIGARGNKSWPAVGALAGAASREQPDINFGAFAIAGSRRACIGRGDPERADTDTLHGALVGAELRRSTATRNAPGISSRRISSRFATSSPLRKLMPVTLPPGRAILATRPSWTGFSETMNTTGIAGVAALAARAAAVPPVTSTETCARTNSLAMAGSRSFRPSANR